MATPPQTSRLFRSFWIAGYEGADHINGSGLPLVMNDLTGHGADPVADYALLREFDIHTVRESVGWRVTERAGGRFCLNTLERRARAAEECGLQVIWTLMHYGYPADVDIFSPAFIDRFARYCGRVARFLAPYSDQPVYSPINEISFLSWAICESRLFHPYTGTLKDYGFELKKHLVRASIAGCEAIWEADPRARIVQIDPLIYVVAAEPEPELIAAAERENEIQFQAWDMLRGSLEPGLGGAPKYLDIIGINYYHSNQWEHLTDERLHWHKRDPRRVPFSQLLAQASERYQRPMFIAETSHVGNGRSIWIRELAEEVMRADQRGIKLEGICLYPIIDRPDWEDPRRWHNSGLWDLRVQADGTMRRVLHEPYARALKRAQRLVAGVSHQESRRSPTSTEGSKPMTSLIVFSHLRWNFVYQRPQHLLSRLAENYPIYFIEEPIFSEGSSFIDIQEPVPNVHVLTPHTSIATRGFSDDQLPTLQKLVQQFIVDEKLDDYVVWLYTPMALPLLQQTRPRAIVYDCMDELSAFRSAPKQLLQRESALLKLASMVFTGGPSLYGAKRSRHPNVHCFPSSVDYAHFAQGRDGANEHPALKELPRPRLGFYGVIDERLDLELIRHLADERPNWQIVLVGPVVKIDPGSLPKRPNIHYFGQTPYADLPRFLAGWDVALMPFALNDSTRFISPTKTLEYMAADRPIVSTPITDVAEPYGDIVHIASDPAAFVACCERALAEPAGERAERSAKRQEVLKGTSWDMTTRKMHELIQRACAEGLNQAAQSLWERSFPAVSSEGSAEDARPAAGRYDCIIIGAGPTGLSAAYHLGDKKSTLLLDQNGIVGGWCRSVEDKGFTFDYAGHIMFSNDSYVQELYQTLLGDNVHWQDREAWIYSKDVYTRYPFQGALYGLPPKVLKECIVGAIEARFGSLKQRPAERRPESSPSACKAESITDCCADGIAESVTPLSDAAPASASGNAEPRNFEEFIYHVWGAGVAKHFAIPYNEKLWAVPLSEMETSWLGGRVPLPDLEEMIEGALEPVAKPMGPNARFGYPLKGGFQALMNGFLPHLKGDIRLNSRVVGISPGKRTVRLADGIEHTYTHLISTMPLPELIKAIGDEAPPEIHQAARGLRHVSVRCVNLGVQRQNITDKHWIYYPEDTVFHRIFVQGNASPHCNPPGGFGLTCEITYSGYKPLSCDGQALTERCIADCIKVGLLREDDAMLTTHQVDMPYAYVVYDHGRAAKVELIRNWLADRGIILAGRYSEWEYYNSDHAFIAGKKAAGEVALSDTVTAADELRRSVEKSRLRLIPKKFRQAKGAVK